MELFNTQTRQKEPLDDPELLKTALQTGTHSFKAGEMVNVKSPDGQLGTVPAENVVEAIKSGYQVETPSQAAVRQYVEENEGLKGSVKVGLGQFADEAAMGLPELIYDKTANPLDVAKKEALKKEHDLSNTVGGLAGFGASFMTGGPLFKAASKAGEKTATVIAEKLAAEAGEEVAGRTLKKIAREIVAKGAGGAVEGAVFSAPHAITEAALGDPSDAAETLMAGGLIGTAFGGGGVLAKDLLNLGKAGVTKGASLITQQKESAETLAARIGKVFSGVDEEAIKHYVANPERVNAAPTVEALKNDIDTVVSGIGDKVTFAKEAAANAKQELDDAYRASTFDLSRTRAPEKLADDLMLALDNEKSVLATLSEQADDALVRSGATFQKQDLVKFINDLGGSVGAGKKGALIGDEVTAAVEKLKVMRDRIEQGLDETIDASTLRDVLRQVRSDINYNQAAGEFNDTANKLKTTFTRNVSNVLKDASPEYAQYMKRMSGLADTLQGMSKSFGTKEKAVSSLNGLMTARGKIKDDLLTKFSELTGKNWQAELEQFKGAKDLLELSKRQDVRELLLPELSAKYKASQEAVDKALAEYEPLRRLTSDSTQNAIRQQAFKNPSIENRKAFEHLSEITGRDFLSLMKDRAVLDAFMKESTNGSRKAVMFGALGGAIGGWPGSAVGGAVGGAMDMYGGRILKQMIDGTKDVRGLLFSEQAMKRAAEKLDSIPERLKRMSDRKPAPLKTLGTDALIRVMDKHSTQESKKETSVKDRLEKLKELNEKTSTLVSNPDLMTSRIAALTGPVSDNGAPNIGGALSQKMVQALSYLNGQMPKPPKPKNAFAPKELWRPSDYDLSKYEKKVKVIQDPFIVLDELENGTLTRSHMEALQAVYPGLHRMISERIGQAATSQETPMGYSERMKLSLILGEPLDDSTSPQSIAYYQSTFTNKDQTTDLPQQQGSSGGGDQSFKAKVDVAPGMQTSIDRVANS